MPWTQAPIFWHNTSGKGRQLATARAAANAQSVVVQNAVTLTLFEKRLLLTKPILRVDWL